MIFEKNYKNIDERATKDGKVQYKIKIILVVNFLKLYRYLMEKNFYNSS